MQQMDKCKNHIKFSSNSLIDPQGGTFKFGFIGGFSLISKGDALGHGLYIDDVFLDQLVEACAIKPLKTKFMHSSLFSDSIGTFLGKTINVRKEGTQVLGDLSFAESSTKTRYNNLADYILTMARQTPDAIGASIEFELNMDEMIMFIRSKGGEAMIDQNGELQVSGFQSDDPVNVNNYPHARLATVSAIALVDEPAANPNGLFSAKFSEIHNEIQKIANLIKQEVEGKKDFGILKELNKMEIKLEKAEEVEVTPVVQEVKVVEVKEEQVVQVLVQVKVEQKKEQEVPEVLSAEKQEIEKLKAMVQTLQAQFSKQKQIISFAKGASPVAPIVEKEQYRSDGLKQKFQKALKRK